MNPRELRAKAAEKIAEAQRIFNDIQSAGREPSADEEARHDALATEAEALLTKAAEFEAREKRLNALDAQLGQSGGRQAPPMPHNDPNNTRNGRHGYSVLKALRQMDPHAKGEQLDGLELEVHQELLKFRAAGGHPVSGVMIPWDLPVDLRMAGAFAAAHGFERRDLTTGTGVGAVVNATLTTMIELLRVSTLMNKLGARILNGMVGNFAIPRQSGAGTGYWINPEATTLSKSNQTIDNVAYSPKTLGAQTVYSRSFLHQTSIDAEMFVRGDLTLVQAIELDRAGFAGSGSGAQPTGIIFDAGTTVVPVGTNGGAPSWALVAQMERGVETQNALNGALAYVTSPNGRYKLKTTVKDSNTAAKYLWNEDTNQVNGYPAYSSNQIPANLTKGTGTNLTAMIFGDFTQAVYAFWGGLDTIVNPYSNSNTGAVEITLLQDADFHLRHGKSFTVMKDMDPS